MKKIVKQRLRVPRTNGFALLELVVALVILGIGLLGVAAVFPLGTRFVNASKVTSEAVALAREKMEEIQSLPAADPGLASGTYADELGAYQRQWTITNGTPMAGMRHVRVTTIWQTPQGTRQYALDTYLFR